MYIIKSIISMVTVRIHEHGVLHAHTMIMNFSKDIVGGISHVNEEILVLLLCETG